MRNPVVRIIVTSSALVAGAQLAAMPAAHATPTTRYASPNGVASADCLASAPCDLQTAIDSAAGLSTIVIAGGNYYQAAPLTDEINDNSRGLVISGPSQGTPAVIFSAAQDGFDLGNSTIENLDLVFTGNNTGIVDFGGPIDHVTVLATKAIACAPYVTLTDSTCVTTSVVGASAVDVSSGSEGPTREVVPVTLRGVTAIATGAADAAIEAGAGDSTEVKLTLANTIAKGGGSDLSTIESDNTSMYPSDLPGLAVIDATHSDFKTTDAEYKNAEVSASASIHGDHTDISAAPRFANAAGFDFREADHSPTINRGATDQVGTDRAGLPRTLGPAPDIGAYERPQRPAVSGLNQTTSKPTSFSAKATINGEGFAASGQVRVTRNGHQVAVIKDPRHPTHSGVFRFSVHGLKPHHKYRMQVIATNKVGTVKSSTLTARTTKNRRR